MFASVIPQSGEVTSWLFHLMGIQKPKVPEYSFDLPPSPQGYFVFLVSRQNISKKLAGWQIFQADLEGRFAVYAEGRVLGGPVGRGGQGRGSST